MVQYMPLLDAPDTQAVPILPREGGPRVVLEVAPPKGERWMFMAGGVPAGDLVGDALCPTITPMRYTSSMLKVEAMTSEG